MGGRQPYLQWRGNHTPPLRKGFLFNVKPSWKDGVSHPAISMSDRATETKTLDRHECRACGYVYDPKKGDPKIDIAPGTAFEDLPQTWVCPVCAARKSAFQNLGQMEGVSGFKANQRYGVGVNGMTEGQKSLLIFGGLVVGFLLLLSMYGLQ